MAKMHKNIKMGEVNETGREPYIEWSLRIPVSLRKKMRLYATYKDLKLQDLTAQALREFIKNHNIDEFLRKEGLIP